MNTETKELTPVQRVMRALESIREEWPNLLTNPALKFDAEKEWVTQACEKSKYAMDAAIGNIDATASCLRNVAAIGVTLDPARKLAYVLPRDSKMVYDLSYRGLIDIAIRAKAIVWAQAAIVHQKDVFELQGYDAPPAHKYNPFNKERGEIVGAYVVVKTPQGDYLTNAMPVEEINGIRDRSPAWKQRDANKPGSGGPWATDWAEMAKKTVVKNGWKYWPSGEAPELLARAVNYLNTDGGQGIDLTAEDAQRTLVSIWTKKVQEAATAADVATVWQDARAAFKEANDADGLGKVREVVAQKNRALGVQAPAKDKDNGNGATKPAPESTRELTAEEKAVASIGARILAAETYDDLMATGDDIDKLGEDAQTILNVAYNERMKYLEGKTGGQA